VYLYGAASVTYGDITLTADRIASTSRTKKHRPLVPWTAAGTVVPASRQFKQDGHTIEADSIRYNFRSKQGLIKRGAHQRTGPSYVRPT
jgi:lipopolysaccharide assembly outer membrane protein LptD (OstA)